MADAKYTNPDTERLEGTDTFGVHVITHNGDTVTRQNSIDEIVSNKDAILMVLDELKMIRFHLNLITEFEK